MTAEPLIVFGGIYSLAFAAFHVMFWKVFRWREELAGISATNRAIMQILNLCLTFTFLIFAYISIFHTLELLYTRIGKALLVLIAVFWFLRAVEQVVFFGLRKKLSMVFFIVFLIGSLIYISPFFVGV